MGMILLIVLVLFFIGALPTWRHSSNRGYFPSGGLGPVLLILLVLVLTGRFCGAGTVNRTGRRDASLSEAHACREGRRATRGARS